jgi:hypothetical protein
MLQPKSTAASMSHFYTTSVAQHTLIDATHCLILQLISTRATVMQQQPHGYSVPSWLAACKDSLAFH